MTVMENVINLLAVLSTKKRIYQYFKLSNAVVSPRASFSESLLLVSMDCGLNT